MISVIITTFNSLEKLLKPCIESIIKYTDLSDIEVIVMADARKDGTSDDTREYVENLGSPFKLIWGDKPQGYTRACNNGIKAAKGDYILLLNDDIVLLPQQKNLWIDLLLNPFKIDNNVGITTVIKFTFDCAGIWRTGSAYWCVLIKRDVFDKIGCLDETILSTDLDHSIKASVAGYRIVQVPNDKSVRFLDPTETLDFGFPIYHMGSPTFDAIYGADKKEMEHQDRLRIKERYGD